MRIETLFSDKRFIQTIFQWTLDVKIMVISSQLIFQNFPQLNHLLQILLECSASRTPQLNSRQIHRRSMNNRLRYTFLHLFSFSIHFVQEEIYSSLKKVRTTDDLTSSQLSIDKHVTMIPLG